MTPEIATKSYQITSSDVIENRKHEIIWYLAKISMREWLFIKRLSVTRWQKQNYIFLNSFQKYLKNNELMHVWDSWIFDQIYIISYGRKDTEVMSKA